MDSLDRFGELAMDRRVAIALAILEARWSHPDNLRQLATAVGLSEPRLQHLFKRDTGLSITAHVKKRQLKEAAFLLLRSHLRVSEICYQVGFQDLSNFDHAFRHAFGMSPRQFRATTVVQTLRTETTNK